MAAPTQGDAMDETESGVLARAGYSMTLSLIRTMIRTGVIDPHALADDLDAMILRMLEAMTPDEAFRDQVHSTLADRVAEWRSAPKGKNAATPPPASPPDGAA